MSINAQERSTLATAVHAAAKSGPRPFIDDAGQPVRDARLWTLLTEQMGLAALLIPEPDGGAGAGVAEVAVVLEQLAQTLAVVPALSSLGVATGLLRVLRTPAATELMKRLATGELTATVAWPQPESFDLKPTLVGSGPAQVGEHVTVSGQCNFVLDGSEANLIFAPVRCGESNIAVCIEAEQPNVACARMRGIDLTRGFASITMADATATVMGADVDLQPALDISLVLIAAEQVGIAQQRHDCATAWAKERIQFGRPIGQFQAIKHQLVDLLMALELARSSLDLATAAADCYLGDPGHRNAVALSIAASDAKARCGEAAMLVARESLHIFGGIGFTWEHDAHLYFRRAKVLEVLLGTPAAHRYRYAGLLLDGATNA